MEDVTACCCCFKLLYMKLKLCGISITIFQHQNLCPRGKRIILIYKLTCFEPKDFGLVGFPFEVKLERAALVGCRLVGFAAWRWKMTFVGGRHCPRTCTPR